MWRDRSIPNQGWVMPLEYLSVVLQCAEDCNQKLSPPSLIDRLFSAQPAFGNTGIQLVDVEFVPEDNEPYEPFVAQMQESLEKLTRRLEEWSPIVFDDWRAQGRYAVLLLQFGHGDGRFILDLSHRLVAACARLSLPLRIDVAPHDDFFPD
jgi:hypothetical protein